MAYVPAKAHTLLIPSGYQNKNHLHVVLTDACPDGDHLLVSITSIYPGKHHDPACVIAPGEHPFIDHDSYAFYRYMFRMDGARIVRLADNGLYTVKEPADDALFAKICAGVDTSRFASRGMKKYFDENRP